MCTDDPASRGFSLARLLVLTKSYAWLVCRMVGLLPTTRQTSRVLYRSTTGNNENDYESNKPF